MRGIRRTVPSSPLQLVAPSDASLVSTDRRRRLVRDDAHAASRADGAAIIQWLCHGDTITAS
jgi:hypothetical protein